MGLYFFSTEGLYLYLILIVPAIIFSVIMQITVKSTYKKYSTVQSRRGLTGSDISRLIMQNNGITGVPVAQASGELTDNFNPRTNTISLSQGVYSSTSVAALGIAAHETGHCCQHAQGYFPIKLRNAIYPVANIGSQLATPLIILGLWFNGFSVLIDIGLILFGAAVVFQLVTLPVEFNASRRAIKSLSDYGILAPDELAMTKKVLFAAAMTYVASLAIALMSLLRLILLTRGRRR